MEGMESEKKRNFEQGSTGPVGAEDPFRQAADVQKKQDKDNRIIEDLEDGSIIVRQGAVKKARANRITVRQGGILSANSDSVETIGSLIALMRTKSARIISSRAGGLLITGDAVIDQSAARVLASFGDVRMDQSASVLTAAKNVKVENSSVVFLIAQKVEGSVKPAFGPKESIAFGAAAGVTAGLILLISRLFRGSTKKSLQKVKPQVKVEI
jgi:hypothetical protein